MSTTYRIIHSIDTSIVGVGSQIQDFSRTHIVEQKLYFYQNENGRFDEDIQLPTYRMESKAKLTDLISNVPLVDNLMISPCCLGIIKKMKLPEFQIFQVKFIYKKNLHEEYVAFSIVKNIRFLDYISWQNSRFYKTTNYHKNLLDEYSFNSIDELMKFKNEFADAGFGLKCEIKLKYQNDFDIINFGRYPMPLGFLCSEKAKDVIIESRLTGFDFELPANDLFNG